MRSSENPFPPKFDTLSYSGSAIVAGHIAAFWAARGYYIRAWRYQISDVTWGVKSNLVNGLPPALRR